MAQTQPAKSKSLRRGLAELGATVGILLAILISFAWFAPSDESPTVEPPQENIKPSVSDTISNDLQLVRLRAEGGIAWTDEQRAAYRELLIERGDPHILRQLGYSEIDPNTDFDDLLANEEWDALRDTLNTSPNDAQAEFWLALLELPDTQRLQDFQTRETDYQALAASLWGIASIDGYAPRDIGLRLVDAEEWAWAAVFFSRQIAADSLDALSYAYRGYARDQQGENGRGDIETAIGLAPNNPIGFFMLGLHHRTNGSYTLSIQSFTDAHLLAPQNPAIAAELGASSQLNDDFATAEEWYKLATELSQEDERFITLQAAFYADTGFKGDSEGRAFVREAAADFPQNGDLQASWGRILYLEGAYDNSAFAFQNALLTRASDSRTLFYYAELLEAQGSIFEAIERYQLIARTENPYRAAAEIAIQRLTR